MTARLALLFEDYETYHRARGNKLCHYLGIPLIAFTLVGLLQALPVARIGQWTVDLAIVVAMAVVLYDLRLSTRLALALAATLGFFYFAARPVPLSFHAAGFLAGWALQFLGHYVYEKRSPAFLKNLQHLMVGPLWVLARFVPLAGPSEATGQLS